MTAPALSYEEQQAALHRQHDGEPEDVHVEHGLPEVNPIVWKDMEPLLFRGFLTVASEINGVPLVFKSINHHELAMLRLMVDEGSSRQAARRRDNMVLAYAVFMLDGVNILPERERWLPEITEMFSGLDDAAVRRIIRHLSELNRRASRAIVLTEAFAMEGMSRLRWYQMRGLDLTSTAVTGIQGTERLGLNWGQFAWRAINFAEDKRELAEREWENAKFVATAMAGKGMQKVHSQDKRRRQQDREAKVARRDKILRVAIFGDEDDKDEATGGVMHVARTVEELAAQLEHDLKGEKDWHDRVVEAHEQKIMEEKAQRAAEITAIYEKNREKFGEQSLIGATSMEGLTAKEVQWRIERRRQIAAQQLAAQQVHPELHDPKVAAFNRKWFRQQLPGADSITPAVDDRRQVMPIERDGDE